MNFIETFKEQLESNGMSEADAYAVIQRMVDADATSPTKVAHRLVEDVGNYSVEFYNILWCILKTYALAYIDEKQPRAWYRPVFLPPVEVSKWMQENS